MEDIPDTIDIKGPDRWESHFDKYPLTPLQEHALASMDDLFTTDIRSRSFLWRLLTEYPFLLDSKEKYAF